MEKWFFSPQEAGTDEAGRGCLAGPVTAAAVILPEDFYHPLLNDSKQMTEKQRNLLRPIIEEQALSYAVVHLSPERIDQINILNASIEAMHQALDKLILTPEFVVVDGNRFKPYKEIPKLPELREKFMNCYARILEEQAEPVKDSINQDRNRVFEVLNTKPYKHC